MHCGKCGKQVLGGGRFCGNCGGEVIRQAMMQSNSDSTPQANPIPKSTNSNVICILLIGVCAVLWLVAPFISVNAATLSSHSGQPTALQILTNDVTAIGSIRGSLVFFAALVSIVCIVICFFCAINRKRTTMSVTATLTNVLLVTTYLNQQSFFARAFGRSFSTIGEVVGIGCIGIFLLLFLACFTCPKSPANSNAHSSK